MNLVTRSNLDGSRVAVSSPCDLYRYLLLICWSDGPVQAVIGLNPSTATHEVNDSTITRCCNRAADLGAGALLMLNAFPFRATEPKDMLSAKDPYGDWRDAKELVIALRVHNATHRPILAWGTKGGYLGRDKEILAALGEAGIVPYCLRVTKEGHPEHPLYLPLTLQPKPFVRGEVAA